MAELAIFEAIKIASCLTTIGHPYQQTAINATAMDLVKWCKGIVGRLSPEQQAQELVDRARETWEDGWPEKGGTPKLRALFREMFEAKRQAGPELQPFVAPPTINGQPLPPYCLRCDDTGWESYEVDGNTYAKLCGCGRKRRPAAQVCRECGGKETRFVNSARVPCHACLNPERRQQIADFLNSVRRPS